MSAILRLRRIMDMKSGRAFFLSFTAGLEVGVPAELADMPAMLTALTNGNILTAAVLRAGVLPNLFGRLPGLGCGVVVDLLGGTFLRPHLDRTARLSSLEHAVRVGADAVLFTINPGGADESHRMRMCGELARECVSWGMPLIVQINTMDLSRQKQFSAVLAGQGARMAYELGADLVVVNYSESQPAFAEALRGIDIPVLVGGGPHFETDEGLLESVTAAMASGARGVCLPAGLFWSEGKPTAALGRVGAIVLGR